MSSNEVTYGFVNDSNILVGHAVFIDGDIETIERVKQEYNATNYYKVNDLTKEVLSIGSSFWNGTRFVHESPFEGWSFNDELNTWEPPLPLPENLPHKYIWNQEAFQWEVVDIPDSPYPSWIFNNDTFMWEAPVSLPDSGIWVWNEDTLSWVERE